MFSQMNDMNEREIEIERERGGMGRSRENKALDRQTDRQADRQAGR